MHGKGQVVLVGTERPNNQHDKVQVRCLRCGEYFFREYKHIHLPHTCPTHLSQDGNSKWCIGCHEYVPVEHFESDLNNYDHLATYCEDCTTKDRLSVKALELSATSDKDGRKIPMSQIVEQYHKQRGKCYCSKLPMTFDNSLRSMSLTFLSHAGANGGGRRTEEMVLVCRGFVESGEELHFILDVVQAVHQQIRLETKIIHEGGQLPFRKRTSDAGYDVHAVDELIIQPGTSASVDTGIIVSPPEGAYYTIEGRSSVFSAGVTPYRGIIDGTYQGPLKVILMNNSSKPYTVKRGDRIAQLILHPIVSGDFMVVDQFTPVENGRMDSGWGSSGK